MNSINELDVDTLKGAKRIIKMFAPVVAIQGHHRVNHLWEIVETIRSLNGAMYQFFFRNYGGISEFTFYAIPKTRLV